MEVRGDGGVGGGGEEEAAESEGVVCVWGEEVRRSGVWVVESVESGYEEDYDEEERTERRWMPERDSGDCCERL